MRWWHSAALIVAIQYSFAFAIEWSNGLHYALPIAGLLKSIGFMSIFAVLGFAFLRVGYYALARETKIIDCITGDIIRSPEIPIALALIALQFAVLSWLKVLMPQVVGFWADPFLANLDAALIGKDPWVLTHLLPLGTLIDQFYISWGFVTLTAYIALVFASTSAKRTQCLTTFFLVVGSSAMLQYLLPAAGPIFFEAVGHGNRFEGMTTFPIADLTANHLWTAYISDSSKVGIGISAWPSVHVGGAAWLALCTRAYFPKIQIAGWIYVGLIVFGSVYLGWHYLVDGIAGIIISLAAWQLAALLQAIPARPRLAAYLQSRRPA